MKMHWVRDCEHSLVHAVSRELIGRIAPTARKASVCVARLVSRSSNQSQWVRPQHPLRGEHCLIRRTEDSIESICCEVRPTSSGKTPDLSTSPFGK